MAFTDEQIKAFPPWLQKLVQLSPEARTAAGYSDEDLEQAAKAYHLDADYTKKSQRAAALDKLQEQYPNLSLDDAVKVWDWWQKNGEVVTAMWPHRGRLVSANPPEEPGRPNGNPGAAKRRWRDAEAADLYETARLREVFEDLETTASERAIKAIKDDWYTKEELPRLDKMAGGYLQTVVDLLDFVQSETERARKDSAFTPTPIREVLKEAAARGERDFRKVATALVDERAAARKSAFDEGHAAGVEEGKKVAEGPSGPIGGGQPSWRPAPSDQKSKSRAERAEAVISTVEKKYGQRLPL